MSNSSPEIWSLGRRIHEARRSKRWSLAQLSEKIGVSKVTVWEWEHGRMHPKATRLRTIGEVLEISIDELLETASLPMATDPQYVILDCQMRVAQALGVSSSEVEIRVLARKDSS